jgi:hypothetical protein
MIMPGVGFDVVPSDCLAVHVARRLPGARRNSFLGPDYATADIRLTRRLFVGDRVKLDLVAEAFNTLNRDNRRLKTSDDGFQNTAGQFAQVDNSPEISHFPAQYRRATKFLRASDAYAPRQIQVALRVIF